MKRVALFFMRTPHQVEWAGYMRQGLKRHDVKFVTSPSADDSVITWGWRQGRKWHDLGHNVLVMERGYVGPRPEWAACGWNGLNGRARFPVVSDAGKRWRQHFGHLMQPWRTGGEYILIMGQVKGDAAVRDIDIEQWYSDTAEMAKLCDKPVMFRPHPRSHDAITIPGIPTLHGTLEEALSGAALVITYNSSSAVDAVLAGAPTLAMDSGSMAWPVASPVFPRFPRDRDAWAARLGWCQWTADEISSGLAWEHLKNLDACRKIG